ncbi:MAG TPA: hypothetical protein VHT03_00125 [Rhizomicrobium sp.]|nr:hypothetical protein [Rhizomicrobium sp.]
MKRLAAVAVLGALVAMPAAAQVGPPNPTGPVCLSPGLEPNQPIPRTKVLDPQHILFYTRDGQVWENTLQTPCRDLMFHGFVFTAHEDEVCSNSTAIRVIESGETCTLGAFRPYTPPPAAP